MFFDYVCLVTLSSSTDHAPFYVYSMMPSDGAVDIGHVDVSISRVQACRSEGVASESDRWRMLPTFYYTALQKTKSLRAVCVFDKCICWYRCSHLKALPLSHVSGVNSSSGSCDIQCWQSEFGRCLSDTWLRTTHAEPRHMRTSQMSLANDSNMFPMFNFTIGDFA